MEEFTFVTISYNQQDYIIEHLESIKNQIIKYGKDYKNSILICDDCSSDKTIEYAQRWLDYNKDYFYKIKILEQEKNQGIVNNYLNGLNNIESDMFSLIAGDDLYFDNSVYEAAKESEFVYTPRISFDSYGMIQNEDLWLFKVCMTSRHGIQKEMTKWMKYRMVVDDMSVKWRKGLCTSGLISAVKKYKWVEDYPTMEYILRDSHLDAKLFYKPIVLYRNDSGISHKKVKRKKTEYDIEQEKMFKDYHLKIAYAPKYINIYNYYFYAYKKLCLIKAKHNRKVQDFEMFYKNECDRAFGYLNTIKLLARNFINNDIGK